MKPTPSCHILFSFAPYVLSSRLTVSVSSLRSNLYPSARSFWDGLKSLLHNTTKLPSFTGQ